MGCSKSAPYNNTSGDLRGSLSLDSRRVRSRKGQGPMRCSLETAQTQQLLSGSAVGLRHYNESSVRGSLDLLQLGPHKMHSQLSPQTPGLSVSTMDTPGPKEPFYEDEPTPIRIRITSFDSNDEEETTRGYARQPTHLADNAPDYEVAAESRLAACFEGVVKCPRAGATRLVCDTPDFYLAYRDYGLDKLAFPATVKVTKSCMDALNDSVGSSKDDDVAIRFKTMIRGHQVKEQSPDQLTQPQGRANHHELARLYLQNNGSQIRMAMVSDKGKAQVCSRSMESFTLENMHVEQIFFCGADWIGFLGRRGGVTQDWESSRQFLEIFSQRNIAVCLHTIKAEVGSCITDIAVQGLDTFALASEDGSVTVKQLVSSSKPWDSFILDDVSHQSITSENRHFQSHSENSITRVVYVGDSFDNYCAVGGEVIYSGQSDREARLGAPISHLISFPSLVNDTVMLAAGLNTMGEVHLLCAKNLTRQIKIAHSSVIKFDDILIAPLDSDQDNSETGKSNKTATLIILSSDQLMKFQITERI